MIQLFIGERLKELRLKYGLSRRQLAKQSGVALSFINDIEKGTKSATVATLERICAAMGITLAEFFAPANREEEPLSPELRRLLENARKLNPEQLAALERMIKAFKE